MSPDVTSKDPSEFTRSQLKYLNYVADFTEHAYSKVSEIALALKVSERTVIRYRADPALKKALQEHWVEHMSNTTGRVLQALYLGSLERNPQLIKMYLQMTGMYKEEHFLGKTITSPEITKEDEKEIYDALDKLAGK